MKNIRSILSGLTLAATSITHGVAQSNYEPYTFTTLAGGGEYSTNAAGVVARVRDPVSLAVDRNGNIYAGSDDRRDIKKYVKN